MNAPATELIAWYSLMIPRSGVVPAASAASDTPGAVRDLSERLRRRSP